MATLGAFSMSIPELPIQVVAVTENLSQGVYTNSTDINSLLLAEGSNLADKLNAHFMTSMSAIPQKCKSIFNIKDSIRRYFGRNYKENAL